MKLYETLYIVKPNLSEEEYQNVLTKSSNLVERSKGVVIKVDEWGKKTLAYPIKKFDQGSYVLLQYCGDGGITREIERDLRLDDGILKYQTIKVSDRVDPDALRTETKVDAEEVSEEEEPIAETAAEEPVPEEPAP